MTDKRVIDFIKESRKRSYGDFRIREALLNHGWSLNDVEKAFASLEPKYKFKNQVTLFLDKDLLDILEKRAKKNMFTLSEQIEDIVRRSCINQKNKKSTYEPRLDDTLASIFSRKNTGPKRKK